MTIPQIEMLQVLLSLLGSILCFAEWWDANRDVRASRLNDDDSILCFAAVAARREEAILFCVHVVFVLSGLYVISWGSHHPSIVAFTEYPSITRNSSILVATLLLASLSFWHRYNRRVVRDMGRAKRARERDRRLEDQHAILAVADRVEQSAKDQTRRMDVVVQPLRSGVASANVKLDAMKDQQTEVAHQLETTTIAESSAVQISAEELQAKLQAQTGQLTDTIEAAKVYTAERADAAKDASAKAEAGANHANQKIIDLQQINEKHAEMLQSILELLQSAGVAGTGPGSPVVAEAKAIADGVDKS